MVDKEKITRLVQEYFKCHVGHMRAVQPHVNDDGSVDVDGDVSMWKTPPDGKSPVKFNLVSGEFRAENRGLVTLEGCPQSCNSLFVASNKLTNLDHVPVYLLTLDVSNNLLSNFVMGPDRADTVIAFNNPLTSLDGLPLEEDECDVKITYDPDLHLLKLLDATSVFIGTPGHGYNRMKPFEPVNTIINKYVGQGKKGALACAAELIKAGYKDNARW